MTTTHDAITGGVNLVAYDGVEAAENFPEPLARQKYRDAALDRSRAQAAFIAEHVGRDLDVLEIGCGNGRLGVALRQAGLAKSYRGIDLSRSRISFAREWAADLGIGCLEFEQANLLEWQPPSTFDLIVCITGAFGYFDALGDGIARRALATFAAASRPGAFLVLELYNHAVIEARCLAAPGHMIRDWSPLPDADPYEFYLHEFRFDSARRLLQHGKTFIPRDARRSVDRRAEVLRLYRPMEVTADLADAGFMVRHLAPTWDPQTPNPTDDLTVVMATCA